MTRVTISAVQAAVCAVCEVPLASMRSPLRGKAWARPRQIAMALSVELTGRSKTEIGRMFKRDHTTVCHAEAVVREKMAEDPAFLGLVEQARALSMEVSA